MDVDDHPLPDGEPLSVRLTALVDELLASPSVELAGPVALQRTASVLVQFERLRVAGLDGLADLDARELYALDGAGSTTGWLRARRVGSKVVSLGLARRLSGRPVLHDALVAGTVDVPAAEKVCSSLGKLPETVDEPTLQAVLTDGVPALLHESTGGAVDPDAHQVGALLAQAADADALSAAERLEGVWVLLASRLPAAQLTPALSYLTDALLPEEHLDRWEREHARTDLQLRELLDGYVDVRGLLDPETAVALRAALAARAIRSNSHAGTDTAGQPTPLTAGQRRVLALAQLLRDAAAGQQQQHQTPDDAAQESTDPEPADDSDALESDEPVDAMPAPGSDEPDGERDGIGGSGSGSESGSGSGSGTGSGTGADTDAVEGGTPVEPSGRDGYLPAAEGSGVQLTLVSRPDLPPDGQPADPPPLPTLTGTTHLPALATVEALLGLPGALPGRYGPTLATSLPTEALRRLSCGAALTAVLLDAAGQPIGASGTHRNATDRERRALLAQWGGRCATDGCPNPGVIPHHVEPFWLSKRTRLKDLIPYCQGCHHDLHEGGHTLRLRDGRWINPLGWTGPPETSLAS